MLIGDVCNTQEYLPTKWVCLKMRYICHVWLFWLFSMGTWRSFMIIHWIPNFQTPTCCFNLQETWVRTTKIYPSSRKNGLSKDSFCLGCWRDLGYAPEVCSNHLRFGVPQLCLLHFSVRFDIKPKHLRG